MVTTTRRDFINKSLTAISGGLILALSAKLAVKQKEKIFNNNDSLQNTTGYRETNHVRTYYDKARF